LVENNVVDGVTLAIAIAIVIIIIIFIVEAINE
jgi:hypothetical protein